MKTNPGTLILVTDKNRHVRELLCRELRKDKVLLKCTSSCEGIYTLLRSRTPPVVAVIDPELCEDDQQTALRDLLRSSPKTYFILHSFAEFFHILPHGSNVHPVVKTGGSIEEIRQVVMSVLTYRL